MLFGKPKRGMFDLPETHQTPPIAPPQDYGNGPIAPKQNAGREPGTGIGALIVGSIGDALLQHSGGQPVYAQNMMQRREMAMRSQMAAAERQAKWEDWKRQFDYEAAHPKPMNNDTVNDYQFIAQQLGEDAAKQYLRNLGDPMVNIPLSDGRFYSGPRSGMGAAMGGMQGPARPVGKLTPIGGPSQPAAGNFRPGY